MSCLDYSIWDGHKEDARALSKGPVFDGVNEAKR